MTPAPDTEGPSVPGLLLLTVGASSRTAEHVASWLRQQSATAATEAVPVTRRELHDLSAEELEQLHATWAAVGVAARGWADFRVAVPALIALGTAQHQLLAVEDSPTNTGPTLPLDDPRLPWTARVGSQPLPGGQGTQVEVHFGGPVELSRVMSSLATAAEAGRHTSTVGLRAAVADPALLPWVAGDATARLWPSVLRHWRTDNAALPPAQVLLTMGVPVTPPAVASAAVPDEPPVPWLASMLTLDVADRVPPVDTAVVNPHNALRDGRDGPAHLTAVLSSRAPGPDVWSVSVTREGRELARLAPDATVSWRDLQALRPARLLDARGLHHAPAGLVARLLTQLAAAGLPLLTSPLAAAVRALLHPALVTSLEAATQQLPQLDLELPDDVVRREQLLLTLRRAALLHHGPRARWNDVRRDLGLPTVPPLTVSAVLVTKRRRHVLAAVAQADAQVHDELEIVVGTHGFELSEDELRALQERTRHRLTVFAADEAELFGEVLNLATRRASGSFVAKLDDDDFYSPHHVGDLLAAAEWSGAAVTGSLIEWIYLAELDETVYRPVPVSPDRYEDWVAGGTLLVRREDLTRLGGWAPVPRAVDLRLLHALRDLGGGIYRTSALSYVHTRHGSDHTWAPEEQTFLAGAAWRRSGWQPADDVRNNPSSRAMVSVLRQE